MEAVTKDGIIEVAQLAAVAQTTARSVDVDTSKGIQYVVIPAGHKVESLAAFQFSDFQERPHRIKQTVKVGTVASFDAYFKRFADEDSTVLANQSTNTVVAVLDYHQEDPEATGEGPEARWGSHRLILTLQDSDEWKAWAGKNTVHMDQTTFAEFIESNGLDIIAPSAATMREVSRDLKAKNQVEFSSSTRLANGQIQLTYQENIKGSFGTGDVEVPETFTIKIPIFAGGPLVELVARLRYRINSGKLDFWYDLLRASQAKRDGYEALVKALSEKIGREVLVGELA
jgi:uncharacterized protein YfdQ (DUF2303 family)